MIFVGTFLSSRATTFPRSRAIACISSGVMVTGTSTVSRTFPFTWMTIVVRSSARRASS